METSLKDILDEKEDRVKVQRELILKYNVPIISFTLNIAGARKDFLLARRTFKTGVSIIISELEKNNIEVIYKKINYKETGTVCFIAAKVRANHLKRITSKIEDNHCLGRIFDIDVIDVDLKKVSREDNNMPVRKCFICDEKALICSRNRSHDHKLIFDEIIKIMKTNTENNLILNEISNIAMRALLYEVSASPKPGLVDRYNNGAHKDMNFFTFVDSTSSLVPYFYNCGKEGFDFVGDNLNQLFLNIRKIGIIAEEDMMSATKGVNTHKGLVFSLGIMCASFGYLVGNGKHIDSFSICKICSLMVSSITENDLGKVNLSNCKTNGEKLYAKHGITGIRGEVEGGFQTVLNTSLPIFTRLYEEGMNINDVCVNTLLNIMSVLCDTNVLARHNSETLEYVKLKAIEALDSKNDFFEIVKKMDKDFIEKNISPGGAADILAITIAIYFFTHI